MPKVILPGLNDIPPNPVALAMNNSKMMGVLIQLWYFYTLYCQSENSSLHIDFNGLKQSLNKSGLAITEQQVKEYFELLKNHKIATSNELLKNYPHQISSINYCAPLFIVTVSNNFPLFTRVLFEDNLELLKEILENETEEFLTIIKSFSLPWLTSLIRSQDMANPGNIDYGYECFKCFHYLNENNLLNINEVSKNTSYPIEQFIVLKRSNMVRLMAPYIEVHKISNVSAFAQVDLNDELDATCLIKWITATKTYLHDDKIPDHLLVSLFELLTRYQKNIDLLEPIFYRGKTIKTNQHKVGQTSLLIEFLVYKDPRPAGMFLKLLSSENFYEDVAWYLDMLIERDWNRTKLSNDELKERLPIANQWLYIHNGGRKTEECDFDITQPPIYGSIFRSPAAVSTPKPEPSNCNNNVSLTFQPE